MHARTSLAEKGFLVAARGPGRFRVHPRRARRTLGVLRAFVKSKAATTCYRRSGALLRTVGRRKPPRRADAADWKRITEPSPRRESFPGAKRPEHHLSVDCRGTGVRIGARTAHPDTGKTRKRSAHHGAHHGAHHRAHHRARIGHEGWAVIGRGRGKHARSGRCE